MSSAHLPLLFVLLISVVIGLLMVLVFGYTSNQKAIHTAKEHLKAHLLALRLYQDQIPVVLRSYGRILAATGDYLRHAFTPLLFVALPLTLLIVQLDRYLGSTPLEPGQTFLIKATVADPAHLNDTTLQLPAGLESSAPPVHAPADNQVSWRVRAGENGAYEVKIQAADQVFSKQVVVASGLKRLSSIRLRGKFWERMFFSGEPALPDGGPIQAIEVQYPERDIAFAWMEWNWIWLFFVLSLIAGFAFKSILGIEI